MLGGSDTAAVAIDDRVQRGRDARADASRSNHAEFSPGADRPDPIDVLEEQARTRVPELVPIRYGRMMSSPFAFFRGAAAVMAHDLASTPATGIQVQACGDAHLSNFGLFASPERQLVFDLNDFDETHPGPWEWDVKRLATSILIAGRGNGFSARHQAESVLASVFAYRNTIRRFAEMENLSVWYAQFAADTVLAEYASQFKPRTVRRTRKQLAKARTRDSMAAFSKLTRVVDGQVRIVDHSPLIVPLEAAIAPVQRDAVLDGLRAIVRSYRRTLPLERRALFDQFELVDFARKVVGVGSVGTRCWIALFLGHGHREPLFMQIKEAERSVLEPFTAKSQFANQGERVVVGQRLMQASSDIFLGWLRVGAGTPDERDFYCRQLKDWKGSAEIEHVLPTGLAAYGRLCGWTLARAHARTGDRVAIAAYLGAGDRFDRAILEFAKAYAVQNERDHEALIAAVASGRVVAEPDV
jgi:uncharacterized protein (DUF2252 family)